MEEFNITSAQYVTDPLNGNSDKLIKAIINKTELWIPVDPDNRHYAEIQKQVTAGTLTIEEAD